jgi:methylglutaconyl-CoA hydratase
LVSVCDVVLATEETVFSLSEVRLGIVPACIGPFVISKIGASQARRFFISADRFKASQARDIGLVHEVYSDLTSLEGGLQKLLDQITQCGPNAMAMAKKLVLDLSWPEKRDALENPLEYVAQLLSHVRISEEGQEGVKAFLEKRKPAWLLTKGDVRL